MSLTATRKWGPNAKATTHRYTKEEVDFFIGYVVETETIYVIPFEAVAHLKSTLSAWFLRSPANKNGCDPIDVQPFKEAYHLMCP